MDDKQLKLAKIIPKKGPPGPIPGHAVAKTFKQLNDIIENQQNIINLQKAEIDNLNIELQAMRGAANSYKAEIERLMQELQYPQSDTVQKVRDTSNDKE